MGNRLQISDTLPPAIFLMGPTASGKTNLAVELVRHLPCEIISVDSALIYKHMDIGTAKPDAEILNIAPHRLIDFLDPSEAYSAARFRDDALREMQDITSRGKVPLLVGGTGLYFRALEFGLSDMPKANPEVRRSIEIQAAQHGWQHLHDRLKAIDPESAARIHPNDPQRLQRALEVYELSGRTRSEHFNNAQRSALPYTVLKFVLRVHDRELLHIRIDERFSKMLERGLVQEVAELRDRADLDLNTPSMRCVGYRQVWKYLDGEFSFETMQERAVAATRQLAKRQMTWLRNSVNANQIDSDDSQIVQLIKRINSYL